MDSKVNKLTAEQQAVVESKAHSLVVNAFAGTGKTSTLVAYAKARPNEKMTYIAFNKSIAMEAKEKFPSNVRCVTSHGLAYSKFGVQYDGKVGQPKAAGLARALNQDVVLTGSALATITNYLYSSAKQIEERHLVVNGRSDANNVFDLSNTIWKRMQDVNDKQVFMPHDGYLKQFQLSEPRIYADTLLLDEAQDSNSVLLDIIGRQQFAKKVYVGDENQAIYGFRKAVDALNRVQADEKLYLTSSFRYGSGIAALATLLLKDWKDEKNSVKGLGAQQSVFTVDQAKPHAIIGRTNSGLFDAAVKAYESGNPYMFVGGVENYRMDMIKEAYHFKYGRKSLVKDQALMGFLDYAEMAAFAEAMDDKELKMLVKIIDQYGHDIPDLTEQIKANAAPKFTGEENILTTAHKAKGMEFDSVVLLDDFPDLKEETDENGIVEMPSAEEINIIYVAATRAKRCLQMNEQLITWLSSIGQYNAVKTGDVSHFVSARTFDHKPKRGGHHAASQIDPKEALKAKLMAMSSLTDLEKAILRGLFN